MIHTILAPLCAGIVLLLSDGAMAQQPAEAGGREESGNIPKQVEELAVDALREAQKQIQGMGSSLRIDELLRSSTEPGNARQATAPSQRPGSGVPKSQDAGSPKPPIPVPDKVGNLKIDAGRGTVEFRSQSSVQVLADFYRTELPKAGWTQTPRGRDRANMVGLVFERADRSLTVTVARIGDATHVMAQGNALISASAVETPATSGPQGAAAGEQPAELTLDATDRNGLPVPKPNSSAGSVAALFRYESFAVVPARPDAILAFYRAQLAARGWTETGQAKVSGATTVAAFRAPDGPARLTLEHKGDETHARLAVRKEAEARKSGLMPKPGMARIFFGSMPDSTGTVSVDGRTVTVPAGVGAKGTDGPSLELKPGKHMLGIRVAGKPLVTEAVEIGAGEIWGVLIGPRGALPLLAY